MFVCRSAVALPLRSTMRALGACARIDPRKGVGARGAIQVKSKSRSGRIRTRGLEVGPRFDGRGPRCFLG